jgi:hypothetical protein
MSLAINPDEVVAVLLSDGWHLVKDSSFALDGYEYVDAEDSILNSSKSDRTGVTGFRFTEQIDIGDSTIAGPISAVYAVRLVH